MLRDLVGRQFTVAVRGLLFSRRRFVHVFDLVIVIIFLFFNRVEVVLLFRELDMNLPLAATPEPPREAWQVGVAPPILVVLGAARVVVNQLGLLVLGEQESFVVLERGVKVVF